MPNDNLGTIKCPFSGQSSHIRKCRTGRYPLYIYGDFAGPIFLKSQAGQEWIKTHGVLFDAPAAPAPKPSPTPKAATQQPPPATPERRSWLPDVL